MLYLIVLFFFVGFQSAVGVIRCYNCTNTEPICDWESQSLDCPDDDDLCVTIAQTRGDAVDYIMGCLSDIDDFRKDIPYRRYPGCRPAKAVESIVYDDVSYCFCRFVDDCSSSKTFKLMTTWWLPLLSCICYVIRA